MIAITGFGRPVEAEDAIYGMLLPFHEYGWGADLGEDELPFLKFDDQEDEFRTEYETGSCARLQLPDGQLVSPNDQRWYVPRDPQRPNPLERCTPDEFPIVDVLNRDLYPTFEAFVADCYGLEARDEQTGRYGYYYNPNLNFPSIVSPSENSPTASIYSGSLFLGSIQKVW